MIKLSTILRALAPDATWQFVMLGALGGLLLPAGGVALHNLLLTLGLSFRVNLWHFTVAPALSGLVGYAFGRATQKQHERDRARKEQARQASELLDGLGTGVFKSTRDGRVLIASQGLSDMFRYASPADMMTASARQFYARPDDRKALIEELETSGSAYHVPILMTRKDGTTFDAFLTAHLRAGEVLGIVAPRQPSGEDYYIVICSSCDQARGADERWQKLSRFLIENRDAVRDPAKDYVFSHGLCPPCAAALYGDLLND